MTNFFLHIFYIALVGVIIGGDGKCGREKSFFGFFVERGKGGGFWWGLDVFSPALQKANPQNWGERGVLVSNGMRTTICY